MKVVTTKFNLVGLHEKHVMATWYLGNHLSICLYTQGNQEKPFVLIFCGSIYAYNCHIIEHPFDSQIARSLINRFKAYYALCRTTCNKESCTMLSLWGF